MGCPFLLQVLVTAPEKTKDKLSISSRIFLKYLEAGLFLKYVKITQGWSQPPGLLLCSFGLLQVFPVGSVVRIRDSSSIAGSGRSSGEARAEWKAGVWSAMQTCLVFVRSGSQARAEKLKSEDERVWVAKGV